jgi:hypothetical protein
MHSSIAPRASKLETGGDPLLELVYMLEEIRTNPAAANLSSTPGAKKYSIRKRKAVLADALE